MGNCGCNYDGGDCCGTSGKTDQYAYCGSHCGCKDWKEIFRDDPLQARAYCKKSTENYCKFCFDPKTKSDRQSVETLSQVAYAGERGAVKDLKLLYLYYVSLVFIVI